LPLPQPTQTAAGPQLEGLRLLATRHGERLAQARLCLVSPGIPLRQQEFSSEPVEVEIRGIGPRANIFAQ
jgi:hypothetical protein